MATVQIADVYNPLTFSQAEQEAQVETNKFLMSGVLSMDPRLNAMASTGGNIGELPFYKPLGTAEPNYSTDNPAVSSTPQNVTDAKMVFRLASQNQSWSTMDLAVELALADPSGAITNRIGGYWATNNERRVIQSAMGLLADNVANDAGDMVNNIATDAVGVPTAAELISSDAVIDTIQTMGDHGDGLGVIAMHSVPYRSLQKQNMIDFIPNARGEVNIPSYQGKIVVVDDSLPAVAGTNRITYTSIVFSQGAMAGGFGAPQNASELDRDPSSGNGGGQTLIYSRRSDIFHPLGFQFLSASVAGQSATQAELALAANWDRVWERKNTGIAFLQTNG